MLPSFLLCVAASSVALIPRHSATAQSQGSAPQESQQPAQQDSGANNPGGLGSTPTPSLQQAQDAVQARVVPLRDEPHHQLVMQNDFGRVYTVSVPPNDATLMHRHDLPYLAINFGAADIENDVQGKPAANLQLADGQVVYSPGGFAHVAKTSGAAFRNVTVELMRPQGAAKNLCKQIVAGPLACPLTEEADKPSATQTADARRKSPAGSARKRSFADVAAKSSAQASNATKKSESADDDMPYFETDEVRADVITVSGGRDYVDETPKATALLVAMTNSNLNVDLGGQHVSFLHTGDILWMPAGTSRRVTDFLGTRSNFFLLTFKEAGGSPAQ
jgi:hypothetical protein